MKSSTNHNNLTYKCTYQSPLGKMILESKQDKLSALYFERQHSQTKAINVENLAIFLQTKKWLDSYFQREIPHFMPPLLLNGSAFALQVWEILLNIPYGKTTSYKEIANILAQKRGIAKMSAQAVGGALKRNKIAIIVPCHRVIGTNATLIGYNGGIDIKAQLLRLENIII